LVVEEIGIFRSDLAFMIKTHHHIVVELGPWCSRRILVRMDALNSTTRGDSLWSS
jgi:hypothetical protein